MRCGVILYILTSSLTTCILGLQLKPDLYTDRFVKYRSLLTGENVVIKAPFTRQAVDTSCLVDDIHCVLEDGNIIDAFFSVNSASDCQYTCSKTVKNCKAFTWFGGQHPIFPNSCFLFTGCKKARKSAGTVSGPVSCSCESKSACQGVKGNFVKFMENVKEKETCQGSCKNNSRCKFYTWFGPDNKIFSGYCFLFSSCEKSSCNCKDCFSGPPKCFVYEIVEDPEILEDDPEGDDDSVQDDPLFPNLTPESGQTGLVVGALPNLPSGTEGGLLGGLPGGRPGATGATPGGSPGGHPGGLPGGLPGGPPGGLPGGLQGATGIISGGIQGGIKEESSGGFLGGLGSTGGILGSVSGNSPGQLSNGITALNPGTITGGQGSGVPGAVAGNFPSGGLTGSATGTLPIGATGGLTGGVASSIPGGQTIGFVGGSTGGFSGGQTGGVIGGSTDSHSGGDTGGQIGSVTGSQPSGETGGLIGSVTGIRPGGETGNLLGSVTGSQSNGQEGGLLFGDGLMGGLASGSITSETILEGLNESMAILKPGSIPVGMDIGNMAGALLEMKPGEGGASFENQSVILNYMPALKWLLVVMEHQRKLEEEKRGYN